MSAKPLTPPGGWIGFTSPRIAPDTSGLFSTLVTSVVRTMGRAEPPNIFLTLYRNPGIFWPWLLFASRFMPRGTIAELDRERVILRVAWNCRCRYEWEQHVDLAAKAGLANEEIARVAKGPKAKGWKPLQKALLQACDEIHRDRFIGNATWKTLAAHYREPQLIELSLLIGHYEMLAGFLNSAGVQLETLRDSSL